MVQVDVTGPQRVLRPAPPPLTQSPSSYSQFFLFVGCAGRLLAPSLALFPLGRGQEGAGVLGKVKLESKAGILLSGGSFFFFFYAFPLGRFLFIRVQVKNMFPLTSPRCPFSEEIWCWSP